MGTYNRLRRLWQPPANTLEAMAVALCEHWRAANLPPERLFWPTPVSWLKIPALRPSRAPAYHFTTGGRLIR